MNSSRAPQARPHQWVASAAASSEADPVGRLIAQEVVVGEAHPQHADDRVDLLADEEHQRGDQKDPAGAAAGRARAARPVVTAERRPSAVAGRSATRQKARASRLEMQHWSSRLLDLGLHRVGRLLASPPSDRPPRP